MTLTLSSDPSSNPTAWERGVTPGDTEPRGRGCGMGKAAGPQCSLGARPPHQLSRQVSQEDKGPLPQLPCPLPPGHQVEGELETPSGREPPWPGVLSGT